MNSCFGPPLYSYGPWYTYLGNYNFFGYLNVSHRLTAVHNGPAQYPHYSCTTASYLPNTQIFWRVVLFFCDWKFSISYLSVFFPNFVISLLRKKNHSLLKFSYSQFWYSFCSYITRTIILYLFFLIIIYVISILFCFF